MPNHFLDNCCMEYYLYCIAIALHVNNGAGEMTKRWFPVYCFVACLAVHGTGILGSSADDVTATDADCPDGFQLFQASCYCLVSDPVIDGVTARTACQELAPGSHLVFIDSQSEQTFIQDLANGQGLDTDYWIGLTYTSDVEHPYWLDGSPLVTYSAWDRYGAFDESSPCVRLRSLSEYLWNDRDCSLVFGYICEIQRSDDDVVPLTTPAPKPTPTPITESVHFEGGPPNMAAPTDTNLLQRLTTSSLLRCAAYCLKHGSCASFNCQSPGAVKKLVNFCELHSKAFSHDELEKLGYKYYQM